MAKMAKQIFGQVRDGMPSAKESTVLLRHLQMVV